MEGVEAAERELRELDRADGDSETQGRDVLFQLPPQFSKNRERSASFLDMLPRCYPYAFEFRHKSWYEDDIYQSSLRTTSFRRMPAEKDSSGAPKPTPAPGDVRK